MLDPNSRQINNEDFRNAARAAGLALMALPFLLNDFSSIFVKDWRVWLAIDYICVRFYAIAIVVALWRIGVAGAVDFGLTRQRVVPFAGTFIGMTVSGIMIIKFLGPVLTRIFVYKLGSYPEITDPVWKQVDLWFGLALTGFTEEIIFRGFMYTVLMRRYNSERSVLLVSSLVFGLIHWNGGPQHIITAGLVGAVFMMFYMRTKSTPALILSHFAIDYYFFSGLAYK